MQYLVMNFENADDWRTEQIVADLINAGIGYNHITGCAGALVGCIKPELDFETFKDKAENIVHDHNGGLYCEVRSQTEAQVEHFF